MVASPRARRSPTPVPPGRAEEGLTETAVAALLIIAVGAIARRTGVLRPDEGPLLVRLVIYVALPPLVFTILLGADLDGALALVPLVGWAVHLLLLGLAWASVRFWGMERPRAGAVIVATAVGNTGFFGVPLIAASGDGFSLAAAVMYDALATTVITWTSTVAVASVYGREDRSPRIPLGDLGKALLLPPNIALALGLVLNLAGVHELPDAIELPLDLLGAAVLPLTMLYAGLMLELRGLGRLWGEVTYVVIMRLGLAALIGLGVARLLGLEGDILHTAVIMAAMPTAMMSLALGVRAGLRADVLAGAVVVTTVLCTLTLPALRAVLL